MTVKRHRDDEQLLRKPSGILLTEFLKFSALLDDNTHFRRSITFQNLFWLNRLILTIKIHLIWKWTMTDIRSQFEIMYACLESFMLSKLRKNTFVVCLTWGFIQAGSVCSARSKNKSYNRKKSFYFQYTTKSLTGSRGVVLPGVVSPVKFLPSV